MIKVRKKHGTEILWGCILLSLLIFCLFRTRALGSGAREGLLLCGRAIVPTIFPFLILCDLLLSFSATETMLQCLSRPFAALLRLSPYGSIAFLFGNLFGFPIGAKTVAKYYKAGVLSRVESERLLLFCGNASPFFLIGSVGYGMFSSFRIGILLYVSQFAVSLMCGIILTVPSKKHSKRNQSRLADISLQRKASFPASVQGAVTQTLYICGYILFFSALISAFLPLLPKSLAPFIVGLLEIGNASAYAAKNAPHLAVPLCAFSACFSGLSVFFQTADCIRETDLSLRFYLPIKLLCGAFSFFLVLLLQA